VRYLSNQPNTNSEYNEQRRPTETLASFIRRCEEARAREHATLQDFNATKSTGYMRSNCRVVSVDISYNIGMKRYIVAILSLLVFWVTSVLAAPAGYPGAIENLEASLKVAKIMVGVWQTPIGVVELKDDGTVKCDQCGFPPDEDILWRVDANPHATDFIIFKYGSDKNNFRVNPDVELYDYKVYELEKNKITMNARADGNNAMGGTWTRKTVKQT